MSEYSSWREMPFTMQIQVLQMNVHRIGITQTLKQAFTGELEIEDLMEV